MKKEEIFEKWILYEFYLYVLPYLFLYGESYVKNPNNSKWLIWQFDREFDRKSAEEKQERYNRFYKQIQESEDNEDERNY